MSAPDHRPTALDARQVAALLDRASDLDARTARRTLDDTLQDLAGLRLPPGSALVTALSNSVRTIRIHLAAVLLGLVPLAVAPATPAARVRRLADTVGARALLTARPDPERYGASGTRAVDDVAAVLLDGGDAPPPYAFGQMLMSTSGTSGAFSVCLHAVDRLLRNARRHAAAVGLTADDTVLVNLPLYYSYAMVAQVLAACVTGARVVVAGPPFTPAGYDAAVARHGVTHSSLTPELARRLLACDPPPAAAPRVLTVGGDRLHPAQVARLLAARPGGELYLTYGLTEAGPRVTTLAAHAEPARRHGSVGLPLPGVRTHVRQETGELVVESDTAMLRKIGAAAADRTLIGRDRIATGDLFRIDEDGYHYVRGRLSDFVVVRGEKVSLSGLRQTVHAIEGVVRCTPRLERLGDGGSALDLEITVTDVRPDTQARIRRELNSLLLPAERPRAIVVTGADPEDFRK